MQLRADLFYRLTAIYLTIPPLRNRIDDFKFLCEHFIKHYNDEMKKKVIGFSPQGWRRLCEYHWPGNIRQLKRCIESAMNRIQDNETTICYQYIPRYLKLLPTPKKEIKTDNLNEKTNIFYEIKREEKERIIVAFKRNTGNVAKAAADLGTRDNDYTIV